MPEPNTLALPGRRLEGLPETIAGKTRRAYDLMSGVYPLSSFLFHSKAHRCALGLSGIRDGMRVLEVATGSGEMFHRLVRLNRSGHTVGVDLSPNMAERTQRHSRKSFAGARADCQAVDARHLPFKDESFDAVMCCYLLELLGNGDIPRTIAEFRRVLRPGGALTLVLIGQNTAFFNAGYKVFGRLAPAFWGRQVEHKARTLLESGGFSITAEQAVRQGFYPSRVLRATR